MRASRFGPKILFRVDLHGVSVTGPGNERRVIRWEWIKEISAGHDVVVRASDTEIRLPPGAFGLAATALAERLRLAQSIAHRPDVIGELDRH